MGMKRRSGILLHPTSLPGRYGIGDLSHAAYRFVDFLKSCGQSLWQILPLGPPGYGNSPYQCFSSMAGNPLLLSLDTLAQDGWIGRDELDRSPHFPPGNVDFGSVIQFKYALLKFAARAFFRNASDDQRRELDEFCAQREAWLPRFAEFMALKDANGGVAWTEWKKKSDPDPADVRAHSFI